MLLLAGGNGKKQERESTAEKMVMKGGRLGRRVAEGRENVQEMGQNRYHADHRGSSLLSSYVARSQSTDVIAAAASPQEMTFRSTSRLRSSLSGYGLSSLL